MSADSLLDRAARALWEATFAAGWTLPEATFDAASEHDQWACLEQVRAVLGVVADELDRLADNEYCEWYADGARRGSEGQRAMSDLLDRARSVQRFVTRCTIPGEATAALDKETNR